MKMKNNLDEMQELELLKIEHNGCWIAFWGLIIAIVVQNLTGGAMEPRTLAGEWCVLMVLGVYLAYACARKGIWDRHIPMNAKTNLIVSVIAGLANGALMGIMSFRNYGKPVGSVAAGIFSALLTAALCFFALTVSMRATKKRKAELDEEPSDADEI